MQKTSNPGVTEVNPGIDAIKKTHKFSYIITNKNSLFNNQWQRLDLNCPSRLNHNFYHP